MTHVDPGTAVASAQTVRDIDWATWHGREEATLVLVVKAERALLIRKKRGLGAGKISAPGGRLEPGETPLMAAAREVKEELCITPLDLTYSGRNRFQFVDGFSIDAHIFKATDFDGAPMETDEALPLWTPINAIPYDEMWEDDRVWLPKVLDGTRFSARYVFDGERMLDFEIDLL